ncbi:hypothetical protein P168DRAFT_68457 [Aspergillus campestris IBT 28561]|uniref:Uncharacterized protein n=1 Tax=Aspergillus campestris (strain IBT 28561) TaxID=1392248 RepID=A0A2I1CS72_ASPC2|nr:uncharacterized protein P168DRAFT_68457 [Aspergillus campestris IBT 28561]PKY00475.1 hypothetical protein P168DRAFT_68457 [Aspergillus campestris IBT 28561]
MDMAQITRLKHLAVCHSPTGLKLFDCGRDLEPDTPNGNLDAADLELDEGLLRYEEHNDSDGELGENDSIDLSNATCESATDGDDDEDDDERRHGIQYFHLGAVLGLFPGLQFDLLKVFNGVGSGPDTSVHTTDCFSSLLAADDYRKLWMVPAGGDEGPWLDSPCIEEWKAIIATHIQ